MLTVKTIKPLTKQRTLDVHGL